MKPENTIFIAEVGQNHQGKIKLAIEYVKVFSQLGANALSFKREIIKNYFQKRHITKVITVKMRLLKHMENIEKS